MDKRRTQLSLDPPTCQALEAIALENGFLLSPPHAARANRQGDWAKAISHLVQSNIEIDSLLGEAARFFDDFLSEHNGSCDYEDGEMVIRASGKVYTRKFRG